MSAREDLSSTFDGRRLSLPGVCRNVFLAFGQLRAGSTRTRGAMNLRTTCVTSVFPVFFFFAKHVQIYTRKYTTGERWRTIKNYSTEISFIVSSRYTVVVAARGPDRNFRGGGGNGAPRRGLGRFGKANGNVKNGGGGKKRENRAMASERSHAPKDDERRFWSGGIGPDVRGRLWTRERPRTDGKSCA